MKIGDFEFSNPLILAPMAGVTDLPFRLMARKYGGIELAYTEMISSRGLVYKDRKTNELLMTTEADTPLAVQVFGNDPVVMAEAVATIQTASIIDRPADRRSAGIAVATIQTASIIDLNFGCPAKKIIKNGDGGALMRNPKLIGEIVRAVVKTSSRPVTAKIRAGWDRASVNAVEVAKICEENGASAIAVHGRTVAEEYRGTADWGVIKSIRENVNIPVIGNGDVKTHEDMQEIMRQTGCDAVMVGRASLGNPYLLSNHPQTHVNPLVLAFEHLVLIEKYLPLRVGILESRKHMAWYAPRKFRGSIMRANTYEEMREIINNAIIFGNSNS